MTPPGATTPPVVYWLSLTTIPRTGARTSVLRTTSWAAKICSRKSSNSVSVPRRSSLAFSTAANRSCADLLFRSSNSLGCITAASKQVAEFTCKTHFGTLQGENFRLPDQLMFNQRTLGLQLLIEKRVPFPIRTHLCFIAADTLPQRRDLLP